MRRWTTRICWTTSANVCVLVVWFREDPLPLPPPLAPPAPGRACRLESALDSDVLEDVDELPEEAPELSWAGVAVALVFGGVTMAESGIVPKTCTDGLSVSCCC